MEVSGEMKDQIRWLIEEVQAMDETIISAIQEVGWTKDFTDNCVPTAVSHESLEY